MVTKHGGHTLTVATKDWLDWHAHYDSPGSGMADHLTEVCRQITDMLDRAGPGPRPVSF